MGANVAPTSQRRGATAPPAYGGVNYVTVLLLAGIAAIGYLGWVFGPPYVLHYEVTQVARDFANRAVKDPNDAELVRDMVRRIRSLDEIRGVDENGKRVTLPTVDLSERDVTWERTSDPPTLHVAFEYTRTLELPLLDRTIERVYHVDLREDIQAPNWGTPR
ncbi:MAG TPA: hypothetical protein VMT17_00945 [Anaeromyxobacteraceae bacterium]|nr:hypothetical protein [Anaeromyxobacteraceae bacterium]